MVYKSFSCVCLNTGKDDCCSDLFSVEKHYRTNVFQTYVYKKMPLQTQICMFWFLLSTNIISLTNRGPSLITEALSVLTSSVNNKCLIWGWTNTTTKLNDSMHYSSLCSLLK